MSPADGVSGRVSGFRSRLHDIWDEYLPVWFLTPMVLFMLSITVFPGAYDLYLALTQQDLTQPTTVGAFVGLDNFRAAFTNPNTLTAVKNTLIFVFGALTLQTLVGFGLAALVAGVDHRIRGFYRVVFILPMAVAPISLATITGIMLNQDVGVIPYLFEAWTPLATSPQFLSADLAMLTVILIDTWNWTPFMFIIFYAGLTSVPEELKEAARVDGAPLWRVYRHVIIPYMKPVLFVAILIRMIDLFRTFGLVFTLTSGGPGQATRLLSIHIFESAVQSADFGAAAAVALAYLVFIVALCNVLIVAVGFKGVWN